MPNHRKQNQGTNTNHQYIADAHQRINKIEYAVIRQGIWNPILNVPALKSNGVGGRQGDYYVVSTDGVFNIDNISIWSKGDWIINGGRAWEKVNNSEGGSSAVLSVNGRVGNVVLDKSDVGLNNVDNASVASILNNSQLTGNTTIESITHGITTYTGAGPHDISVDGSTINTVIHTGTSSILLPETPLNGPLYIINNEGTGTIIVSSQGTDTIATSGLTSVSLLSEESTQFVYINGIWKIL